MMQHRHREEGHEHHHHHHVHEDHGHHGHHHHRVHEDHARPPVAASEAVALPACVFAKLEGVWRLMLLDDSGEAGVTRERFLELTWGLRDLFPAVPALKNHALMGKLFAMVDSDDNEVVDATTLFITFVLLCCSESHTKLMSMFRAVDVVGAEVVSRHRLLKAVANATGTAQQLRAVLTGLPVSADAASPKQVKKVLKERIKNDEVTPAEWVEACDVKEIWALLDTATLPQTSSASPPLTVLSPTPIETHPHHYHHGHSDGKKQ
eukprot:TRINITY_DN5522_c0_g1_i3.p1 TRINITY_DN5522_c0_g1~~TRINITY_DN5522_c0_g1_i3.p1  ORF type:complete len:264 (-),score=68.40 TRINITY_DN5522_c0_g1_i3:513-1304(-)